MFFRFFQQKQHDRLKLLPRQRDLLVFMSSFAKTGIKFIDVETMQSFFDEIPPDTIYLDCAGRSPLPSVLGNIGMNALNWKVTLTQYSVIFSLKCLETSMDFDL